MAFSSARPRGGRRTVRRSPGWAARGLLVAGESGAKMPDLHFYFDPICPFAWMTSKWVRQVAARRPLAVEWRFISLRLVNHAVDYAAHFPPGYERGHTAGLELLRVAAALRREQGAQAIGLLYAAMGAALFEQDGGRRSALEADSVGFVMPILEALGIDPATARAAHDSSFDAEIRAETDEALEMTGRDVGTPILHFDPPEGTALFGPVISRLPGEEEGLELFDHVVALSRFPGFAELKRSLRETLQLPAYGLGPDEVGVTQDWEQGHRRAVGD